MIHTGHARAVCVRVCVRVYACVWCAAAMGRAEVNTHRLDGRVVVS